MIDGLKFKNQLISANELLLQNIDIVNSLNVFPVPDGDTGTNMSLTMQDGIKNIANLDTKSVGIVAQDFYKGVFYGARGNSGVILSQFFRGFSESLKSVKILDSNNLCASFLLAKKFAYQGIVDPVEGTMLTLINDISDFCNIKENQEIELVDLLYNISELARSSVLKTPTLLPILEEAGVVDSGAYGLEIILNAMYKSAANLQIKFEHIENYGKKTINNNAISKQFLDKVEHEEFGYCTQLLISGSNLSEDDIKKQIVPLGKSAVLIGDENLMKIHIHAEDPGSVLTVAGKFGQLSEIDIANMDQQHSNFDKNSRKTSTELNLGEVSVLSVVQGNGFERIFRDLGVHNIINCKNTMNPSVSEISDVVDQSESNSIIILPNNKNVIPAAIQVAKISDKDVRVIESVSMTQGIASMLSFRKDLNIDESFELLDSAILEIQYGEISISQRSARFGDIVVEKGEFIGFLNGQLLFSDKSLFVVFDKLLKHLETQEIELVTLYNGIDFADYESEELVNCLEQTWEDVDFEVHRGEQPNYHIIFSVE
ncbi:MAG: DAK2 domain-containing protein [SAR202 cluster bacterium]|nr:DAK2 domain-containing protein [SAR202 cluster bacterium]|tara:strand:- start:19875 stop:21500 length:1626 start_codon:yes stop_codon:yes gene_type:complete